MRKLAGEATIFGPTWFPCSVRQFFLNLEMGAKISAKRDVARAVSGDITAPSPNQGLPSGAIVSPIGTVEVPLTGGTLLHIRECQQATGGAPNGIGANLTTECLFRKSRVVAV